MDYQELTVEMLRAMNEMHKAKPHRDMDEFVKGEAFALQYLMEHGSAMPSDLGVAMGTTTARVAAILNSLDKKGLILRQIDNGDRRRIIVELTDEGRTFAKERQAKMMVRAEQMLRSLGDEDAKEYVRILKKLVNVNRNNEPTVMEH